MTCMRTSWQRLAALLHLGGRSTSPGRSELGHQPRSSPPPNPSPSDSHPSAPITTDPTTSYLADLLREAREELTRADSKAALLLAAAGVAVGALLAGLLGGKWSPLNLDNRVEWIWWLGVACVASGIFSIAAAVYPRIHPRRADINSAPSYYGDVAAFENIAQFRQAIEKVPSARERLIDQTFQVSRIAQRKYLLLRRGLRLLLLAILACSAAVIINIPLSH